MRVRFLGAAQTVTGSMHLLEAPRATVLLDCGLFQGPRRETFDRNRNLPFDPRTLDAVVLSHAHIDHSGALPMLPSRGFHGTIFCTPATRDLCAVMLEDAAMVQEADARFLNKQIERGLLHGDPIEPLYGDNDVINMLETMIAVPYHRWFEVAHGVRARFLDAGHVLGSAIVELDVRDGATTKRVVFSGDVGRRSMPILRDPEIPERADLLLMESTYGDRVHPARQEMDAALADVVRRTVERGGKVIVPTFALERAQEIILSLKSLTLSGAIPTVPVIVDSPLAVKITEVFRMHPDCYDEELHRRLRADGSPFDFDSLRYVASPDESKRISADRSPMVILAGSGMCESGRVLHHLRVAVEETENTVVIVGFQAPHTLGRRLVEKRTKVRIFGVERDRRCDVVVLNGFSAHAGQDELVGLVRGMREKGGVGRIALVHGEPGPQRVLSQKLAAIGQEDILAPERGDALEL
ncbi:MAG: MBL fold metallo-hydrolase [Deltaproteobacteria bacterium]|nr:MBL fold metallo-hydrolase [Deltaproteobacteria bacterium]